MAHFHWQKQTTCSSFARSLLEPPIDCELNEIRLQFRPAIENRAPASVEQFHRETTGQVATATEPTFISDADFDQWETPQRSPAPRPSSASRPASPVRTPVEEVIPQPPRGSSQTSNNRFNQQETDVDYRDTLVDEFVTSEPSGDQFADYDIFEDSK